MLVRQQLTMQSFLPCKQGLPLVDNSVNPREYLKRIWLDSLVHDKEALLSIISLVGSNRIVLGSDYPFPLGEHKPGSLIEATDEIDETTKQQLLWDNCLEFLGLPPNHFD